MSRLGRCAAIVNAVIPPVELPARLAIRRGQWCITFGIVVRQGYLMFHTMTFFALSGAKNVYLVVGLKPGIALRGA